MVLSSSSNNFYYSYCRSYIYSFPQVNPLALRVLDVYLQWNVNFYKNHYLALATDDNGVFDETTFQPAPPRTQDYRDLAEKFKTDTWEPIAPLTQRVL